MEVLLEVKDLSLDFFTQQGAVRALNGISYRLAVGERVGLIGETGSGKTASALSILGLIPGTICRVVKGQALFAGQDLLKLGEKELRHIRGGKIGFVFQEPLSALNPLLTVGRQLREMLTLHCSLGAKAAKTKSIELLNRFGIPNASGRIHNYPHQFSGGMRQRLMIAIAISSNPRLLILDEPTTALDIITQWHILDTIEESTTGSGAAVLLITHDLRLLIKFTSRVYVMVAGQIVETGGTSGIIKNPLHPYTVNLLEHTPRHRLPPGNKMAGIPGGCVYYQRCPHRSSRCSRESPRLEPEAPHHEVACWHMKHREHMNSPALKETSIPVKNHQDIMVEVKNLKKYFYQGSMLSLSSRQKPIKAVDNVSFSIEKGEIMGLVGETGSGKTTLARCLLLLCQPTSGEIIFGRRHLNQLDRGSIRRMRCNMQIIFQDPYNSLNPRMKIKDIISEPLRIHRRLKPGEIRHHVHTALESVGLNRQMAHRYAHELSGGQRQRIAIARAIALKPAFVILDEPISQVDSYTQKKLINLLVDLHTALSLTYLFISHDLYTVQYTSSRVAVMYLGKIVEIAPKDEFFSRPCHPYTTILISSMTVDINHTPGTGKNKVTRTQNNQHGEGQGCNFFPQCPLRIGKCKCEVPELKEIAPRHWVACHLL